MVTLDDIRTARERIAGRVRRTPMIRVNAIKHPPSAEGILTLKLECLQVTGSFKPRGAVNKMLSLSPEQMERGVVTASGGNHGLAIAYLGWQTGKPAVVYVPESITQIKIDKIRAWGAQVVVEGAVWNDSNAAAMAHAEVHGMAYIHPFADPVVIAGQGTLGLEILDDLPEVDTALVAIGGGGLISGVASALKALKPDVNVVGIEAAGAPAVVDSLAAGHLVELAEVTTRVSTLAPRRIEQITLDHIRERVDEIILISDEEMAVAARWLWFEMGVAAELSGAAAFAALVTGKYQPRPGEQVCVLVCGAGADGIV